MRVETAREFLETAPEELLEIEGMSKQLLLELRQIILIEFDERESQAMKDRINNAEIGYIASKEDSDEVSKADSEIDVEQDTKVDSEVDTKEAIDNEEINNTTETVDNNSESDVSVEEEKSVENSKE